MRAALLLLSLALAAAASAQDPKFMRIHEGKRWIWYARSDHYTAHKADIERFYDYADRAYDHLVAAWGLEPPPNKYALLVYQNPGGGFAAGDVAEVRSVTGKESPGIGVSFDAFFNVANGIRGYWATVLITHEMVNLFTGQIVSGGWPVDWWANHRSPFPLMTAVQIEYALAPEVAVHHAKQLADPFVQMFQVLKDRYGWHMFRRAFQLAIEDGINWDRFGENPSALRTNYVAAYLELGAPESVLPVLAAQVPNLDPARVKQILAARGRWLALPEGSQEREAAKAAYLAGKLS